MTVLYSNYYEKINASLMNFKEIVNVSFEFFPPNNVISQEKLWLVVDKLKLFNPKFFSVTCGTNISTQVNTYDIVKLIIKRTGINTVPHLTCINSNEEELRSIAQKYWENGIHHVLALRGDSSNISDKSSMYALDLIKLLKSVANFEISVAAYPEVHPEAYSAHQDVLNLKKKVDAGATRAITQFFFSIEHFLRFRDRCVKNSINIDIVPGILPIVTFNQLYKFASMSNITIPDWLLYMFDGLDNHVEISKIIGASVTIDIVKSLFSEGVRDFHFYTLNQLEVSSSLCHILGIKFIKNL